MSKVILVTGTFLFHENLALNDNLNSGANSGIGFELVRILAEKNYTVYLGARNEAAGKEAVCVAQRLLIA
jgi:short-subunit dehydrogenase involved in D-alanine esterification of teichoic acids